MRRAHVALATCRRSPDLAGDAPLMVEALGALDIAASVEIWDAPSVDWSIFDLVVLRGTWDYTERRDEFLAWARSVPRLANPSAVAEWNTDKTYLADLAAAGIATIPTTWLHPDAPIALPPGEIVVKRAISAGARGSGRYGPGDRAAARDHVVRLQAAGHTVLVQPYFAAVEVSGEHGLVYLGDRYSHTIAKPAALDRRGPHGDDEPNHELVVAATPSDAERAFAETVLAAIPGGRRNLLYARVDVVADAAGNPALMEAELTEPGLYLRRAARSPDRFARAVANWLARP